MESEIETERDILDLLHPHSVSEVHQQQQDLEESFFQDGCGCKKKCDSKFDQQEVLSSRRACSEMKYYCSDHINHHHTFIMGALQSLLRTSAETMKKGHPSHARKSKFLCYQFRGQEVCQNFFMFVNNIGERELKNLRNRFSDEGVTEQMHRNYRKSALNSSLPVETRERCIQFLQTFSLQHGLILPGGAPGFRKYIDLIILPSRMPRSHVYELYKQACVSEASQPVSRTMWYSIWETFCPNIVVQKPRSDLCTTCQRSIVSFSRLQNLPEETKKAKNESSLEHLTLVTDERKHYYDVIESCREKLLSTDLTLDATFARIPCSYDGPLHYSFDYAQQIFVPHSSQQVGSIYFLTPYKVGLFGVCIEPLNRFVLYVIPEACTVGKGANSVLSFLHHALENFGIGEKHVILHCDNCIGQNKNNITLQFLAYQTFKHRYESIEMHCLPVGHTKFAPDARFGNFKTRWNREEANCLKDVCKIACHSKSTYVVLIGNEVGDVFVEQFQWSEFFKAVHGTKNVSHIRSFHHFRTTDRHGTIACRTTLTANEECFRVLPSAIQGSPAIAAPVRLPEARQTYLYETIREYVSEEYKDILCPKTVHSGDSSNVE